LIEENNIEFNNTIDDKWEEVREIVLKRDNYICQLSIRLTDIEWNYIQEFHLEEFKMFSKILDCAHMYPKGSNPEIKYNPDYVVTLCRYFHSLLEQFKNPVTRKGINREQRLLWFKRMKVKKIT